MSSTSVVGTSLLLTAEGWLPARSVPTDSAVIGINRHGRTEMQAVVVRKQQTARCAFVGTSQACGEFAEDTRLLFADGKRRTVNDVVTDMLVSAHFETVAYPEKGGIESAAIAGVWAALRLEASSSNEDVLIIRRRAGSHRKLPKKMLCEVSRLRDRVYLTWSRNEIVAAVKKGRAAQAISDLIETFVNEDGSVELARSSSQLAMLIAYQLSAEGRTYEFSYDSLQHTAMILLLPDVEKSDAVSKGRCAHYLSGTLDRYSINWTVSSWNPVVNGLVVAQAGA